MMGIGMDNWLMIVLTLAAFVLVYIGGKRLIFHKRGKLLVFLGIIAALGAIWFGEKDNLPEGVREGVASLGSGVQQWTSQNIPGLDSAAGDAGKTGSGGESGSNGETGGLFSALWDSEVVKGIRNGLSNLDAVKTFFDGSNVDPTGESYLREPDVSG